MAVRLELEDLEKRFAEEPVLQGVALAVEPGETLALLGPSGSGKTTALRITAGFETPDRGRITVDGEDVTRLAPERRRFGMVFQHYALFPHLSVAENVAFGLESTPDGERRWRRRPERLRRVAEMLELVGLGGLGERRIGELSGGQQQRVALARALAPSPRVLLLDEPLSNLDPALRERTREQLREAVDEVGITTVLVTHEQEEAFHLGDRVAVLHRGRLEQIGPAEELYRRPRTRFVAGFVGRASELPARLEARGADGRGTARITGTDAVWDVEVPDGRLAAGAAVVVAVRPETLELVEEPGDRAAPDVLRGRLVDRRFTGPTTSHRLEIAAGAGTARVEVSTPGVPRLTEGARSVIRPRDGGPGPWAFAADEPPAAMDDGETATRSPE